MTILDTFTLLFESDTDDLEKGAKKAEDVVDGITEGLDKTDKKSQEMGESFLVFAKGGIAALAAFFAAGKFAGGVMDIAKNTDALGKFSELIDENVEDLNVWGQAVMRNGGTLDGFLGTVDGLNQSLVETARTGTGGLLPFFNQLGISLTDNTGKVRTALDVLPELADAFTRLPNRESAGLGRALGLDPATIRLLQQGRESLDAILARQREFGFITKEQTEIAAKFNNALADNKQAFASVARDLEFATLPLLTTFLEVSADIVSFFANNDNAGKDFAILMGGPTALALDDLQNFLQGNKSVLGELEKDWPKTVGLIRTSAETLIKVWKDLKKLIDDFDFSDVFDSFSDGFDDAADKVSEKVDEIRIDIEKFIRSFKDMFSSLDNPLSRTELGFLGSSAIGAVGASPLASISGAAGSVRGDISINIDSISIDAAGLPAEEIGNAISSNLEDQLKGMLDQFDDGVLA